MSQSSMQRRRRENRAAEESGGRPMCVLAQSKVIVHGMRCLCLPQLDWVRWQWSECDRS